MTPSPLLLRRTLQIIQQLKKSYPQAHCELDHANPLQLLIATILSAQCTDVRVNLVTPALFLRCRHASDYATIPQTELEGIIPALETSHALARLPQICAELGPKGIVVVNLSGRGDKDVWSAARALGTEIKL